ncbi:MAG: hypothetical protein MUE61_02250 [Vicinamibacterales bacterium]|jgi:hypothetical protein|nr:hypothetical protein [Vicinamibacterales bacterium]
MTLAASHRRDPVPGLIAAAIVLSVYGAIALSTDFSRVAFGIQSDEATYYMMGHSLAEDGDFAYRREDLARVWREFPSGPSGVFLKKGTDLDLRATDGAPFLTIDRRPDPDTAQLFYGKSYIYPLVAAPFVALFGTNGFLFFHAILLALATLAAYLFLNARSSPIVSLVLASAFFMASVAPTYFVWITPELFNFSLVLLGYFCWLYKEVAAPETSPRGTAWLFKPGSDLAAAALIALATFSKPSNLLLILPLLAWLLARRQWRRLLLAAVLFGAVGAVLLAGNVAITGDWNFQGGDRRTFYGSYPFQERGTPWEEVGQDRATNRVLWDHLFDGRVFWTVFSHNLVYVVVGRYAGLLPYFFPGLFAIVAFLLARGQRTLWQWLILGAAAAEVLLLLLWVPYTFNGGGGSIGNRYFMSTYGVLLFLLPPIASAAWAFVPWAVGTLFSAQVTFNPFFSSFNPAEQAKQGPLRWLPVELTLVNDLPINTQPNRARIWFGEARRFQIYFLDDNAYAREDLTFWVKGRSTAEFLVKTVEPASALDLDLASGEVATSVTVSRGWRSQRVELAPNATARVSVPLDDGFPYIGTRVWRVSIRSSAGFVPLFISGASADNRFLGVRVKPELRQ